MNAITARQIRRKILNYAVQAREGHIASSFSIVEILMSIVHSDWSCESGSELLPRLVLSKGHGVLALYGLISTLKMAPFDDREVCRIGGGLVGHVPISPALGLDFGTGSLGHGLPYSVGRAYRQYSDGQKDRIYCIVGDGELNEGSCYEALLMLRKFPHLRLTTLIDYNRSDRRGLPVDAVIESLHSHWGAVYVDGHNYLDMSNTIQTVLREPNCGVQIIICKTEKGYPIKDMINNPSWHHKIPTDDELKYILSELGIDEE